MSSVPSPSICVYDHQKVLVLGKNLIDRIQSTAQKALPQIQAYAKRADAALFQLEEIEVSLVDDETIADVHLQFMSIPGATDVITFDHGEIHISVETARRQAEEYFQPFEMELMLYVFHGLLHLAGHEDATERGQAIMDTYQSQLLKEWW